MRFDRLTVLLSLILVIGCKTTQTTSTVGPAVDIYYTEDLSVWRPEVEEQMEEEIHRESVLPAGHLEMEIDSISAMIVDANSLPRTEQGYAIQVYIGASRDEATSALGRVRVSFPQLESSMVYFQPNFNVKTGKFLDRIEAYETYQQVKKVFRNALLVPEQIEIN